MPKLTYVAHDGETRAVNAPAGTSAMQAAVDNGVPGILADCGGSCSCATCHVYVDAAWLEAVGPASGEETELLDSRDDVQENSRLACQIALTDAHNGLVLYTPKEQY